MTRLLAPAALMFCVAIAGADEKKAPEPKKGAFDAAKLVGDWTYVSGMKAGEKVEKDNLKGVVKVSKDRLTLPSGVPDKPFVMAYTLDTKSNPVQIDMEIKGGPVAEGKAKGIVAVEGDTFRICYHPTGGDRPKKFESSKDNGAFYFVLKRSK